MQKEFDFIIVGAGSAGCLLANRLSFNPNHKVLIIEAGGKDFHPYLKIPAAYFKLWESNFAYQYYSEPEKELNGRKLFMPRGKTLGGSSAINAMIYIRGHQEDFDEWEKMGNTGWAYKNVLPYFMKSENNEDFQNEYHSKGGDLNVKINPFLNEVTAKMIEAASEIGIPQTQDFNAENQIGVGPFQTNTKDGKRHSAADAFLKPALKRPNLTVIKKAVVIKVLIENNVAVGVEYKVGNRTQKVYALQKVILCAGAIDSPKILMLSGIGNFEELNKVDIKCLHHLPGVGKNLQDHPFVPLSYTSKLKVTYDKMDKPWKIIPYLFTKKGPLSTNIAEAGGFFKSNENITAPDLQWHFIPAIFKDHGRERPNVFGFTACSILLKPKSRGFITLRSNNPSDTPKIHQNFFHVNEDLQTLIEGFKITHRIMNSEKLSFYRHKIFAPENEPRNDFEIETYIRKSCEALYHPVGTCKMGNDELSVVDSTLHVRGIENLMVVDASIMPTITRGNTNAPTYMIAEKAADIILLGM